MLKVLEVKETLAESNLLQDMYKIEALIKDISQGLEAKGEMNYDDYNFTSIIFEKTRIALQKVYALVNIGGDIK